MSASREDFGIAIRSALLKKGARQKFSLFFLIVISTLIFFLDSIKFTAIDITRSFLRDGIYRASSIASSPIRFVKYSGDKIKLHFSIYDENKILKEELNRLKNKDLDFEFLSSKNRNLQKLIETDEEIVEETVLAKVLLDKNSPFLKSVIINKGKNSQIKKGMPVVDGNYLVGKTVEVNYLSSRVLLLNDLNSRIPVTLEPDATQAILVGNAEKNPILEYLPEFFEVEEGKTVFASGKDGIFPAGIPVGKIFLEEDVAKVKLFSDPNQISFLNIVLTNTDEIESF